MVATSDLHFGSEDFDLRLYGTDIFNKALGESGGASIIGSRSEHCFWVGPELDVDPAALGGGLGIMFAVKARMGSTVAEVLGVVLGWAGDGGVSATGLAHVVVPARLTEPDFTKKKAPLS